MKLIHFFNKCAYYVPSPVLCVEDATENTTDLVSVFTELTFQWKGLINYT